MVLLYIFTGSLDKSTHNFSQFPSWNCCDRRTRFVVIWKHFCFIPRAPGYGLIVMRLGLLVGGGGNTSVSITVTVMTFPIFVIIVVIIIISHKTHDTTRDGRKKTRQKVRVQLQCPNSNCTSSPLLKSGDDMSPRDMVSPPSFSDSQRRSNSKDVGLH